MTGIVYKSTGLWYSIIDDSGRLFQARLKGIFKQQKQLETNPIAVGDCVDFSSDSNQQCMITKIYPRRNFIARESIQHRKRQHIIAANIDQSILMCSIPDPTTPLGFIDRFLVSCELFHIHAILVFNKQDAMTPDDLLRYKSIKNMYETIGYQVFLVSVVANVGMDKLTDVLQHKTSLISGQSGVGKSSFINYYIPSAFIDTQNVNAGSGKGVHTTTFAEMYQFMDTSNIIDSPGIKELGLVNVEQSELSQYFPEMRMLLTACKYHNCVHIAEPECAIKNAVKNGKIFSQRYTNYVQMYDSILKYRWQ
ncbi:MAG: ribosome small subunit-dependent GTPase A [Alphaproteobacteria bacterium]|nr:ribosome small subunit-dependent GTPase A [Alphaproteobacteria bacterium]